MRGVKLELILPTVLPYLLLLISDLSAFRWYSYLVHFRTDDPLLLTCGVLLASYMVQDANSIQSLAMSDSSILLLLAVLSLHLQFVELYLDLL